MKLSLYEPNDWPELLSPAELAEMLRLAPSTVTRWCEQGAIEATKLGGRKWRIPREAVRPLVPPSIQLSCDAAPQSAVTRESS